MKNEYTILIGKDEDGYYVGSIPAKSQQNQRIPYLIKYSVTYRREKDSSDSASRGSNPLPPAALLSGYRFSRMLCAELTLHSNGASTWS